MKKVFLLFMLPYFAALFFTLAGSIWNAGFAFTRFRAVSLTGQMFLILMLAAVMVTTFRDECINIVADAMILAYLYSFIIAFFGMGFDEIIHYLTSPYKWQTMNTLRHGINYLERHDLGAAVGLIILCKIFFEEGKKEYLRIILLLFLMYSCYKRIELLAFFAAFCAGILLKKVRKTRDFLISFLFTGIFICCFIYIFLVGSGLIYKIVSSLGLSIAERINLFRSMSGFYELSLGFPGRGFGYTEKYLGSIAGTEYAYRLGNAWMGQMHNDILRMYIELGAAGSFLWFGYFLKIIPAKLKKYFGAYAKYVYFLVMVYAYISYTMDNTINYLIFQFSLYTIIICGCYKSFRSMNGLAFSRQVCEE